jgi:hypothetical protein
VASSYASCTAEQLIGAAANAPRIANAATRQFKKCRLLSHMAHRLFPSVSEISHNRCRSHNHFSISGTLRRSSGMWAGAKIIDVEHKPGFLYIGRFIHILKPSE